MACGLLILALLAGAPALAAAQTPPPANTVSGLTVPAPARPPPPDAVVDVAGDADMAGRDFVAIWPGTAYQAGADGHVTLSCLVDVHGLAEKCRVADETPKDKGFGRAALELRPTFVLTPAKGPDGQPVNATMSLSIRFQAPKRDTLGTEGTGSAIRLGGADTEGVLRAFTSAVGAKGNPMDMKRVVMVDDPVWVEAAGFDDLARAYPAKAGGVEGYAAAHCQVERSGADAGALKTCQVIKESPHDLGFGKAALTLTSRFRVAPAALARAPRSAPLWVDVPIRFPRPDQLAERTVTAPAWIVGIDPAATPRVFPPEAAASGLTTGRGVARCTVGPDGSMTACAPEPGEPDGLGFSEAATKLASNLRMNLWSADGVPVQGGVVHIPIRLNLKGAAN